MLYACQKTDFCLQYASNSALARFRTYTDSLKLKDTTLPAPFIVYTSFANQYGNTPRINILLNGAGFKIQPTVFNLDPGTSKNLEIILFISNAEPKQLEHFVVWRNS